MSDGVPDEFHVELQEMTNWMNKCPYCSETEERGVALFFGYKGAQVIVSGTACSDECARSGLWKKYVLERLKGALTQAPTGADDGPHGDHAED